MQTPPSAKPCENAWAEQFVASLQAERDRVHEFLATEQARLQRVEAILEEELARGDEGDRPNVAPTVSQRPTGSLDWEAEKRRLLAALESEADEDDEERAAERVKIAEVLRVTNKLISEKDQELDELKRRLEEAVEERLNPAAVAAALDADAIVQQEREQLRLLQDEWQEKLRQAEVELSVERARLARQCAEVNEQIRLAGLDPSPSGEAEEPERPSRGRWLTRLGLSEKDRVRRRNR